MAHVRKIKLQPKYSKSRNKHQPVKIFPSLNLSGEWLKKAGYHPHEFVEIFVYEDYIVIKKKES